MRTLTSYFMLVSILVLLPASLSHLEGIEKVVGDYKLELGLIPEEPKIGESTAFSLALENVSSGERFQNVDAWVRISKDDSILFSSANLKSQGIDSVKFSYMFSKPGTYELTVRFTKEDGEDVQASFFVFIEGKNEISLDYSMVGTTLGSLIMGLIIGYHLKKGKLRGKRKRK